MGQALEEGKVTMDQMMDALAATDPSRETENAVQVRSRMQNGLRAIAEKVSADGGGNVLVVSHGMAILSMLRGWAPDEQLRGPLKNASVTKITYLNGKFSVGQVGDMSYVEKSRWPTIKEG
jgi:probable phosphoglycerate mutase